MKVIENLNKIAREIEQACEIANRNKEDIKIIAVTKYVSTERAEEAVEAGICHLGENRDEGLLKKWEALKDKPIWHYIGSLQTRKVKNVIDKVDYIHSLDRISLASEIQKRAERKIKCLVQVNVSNEESKHGLEPNELFSFIHTLKEFDRIQVVGLMTMAPLTDDEGVLRDCFRTLRELQNKVKELNLDYAPCEELSMGMSNDFHIAVEEGATMVRIGTALVGE